VGRTFGGGRRPIRPRTAPVAVTTGAIAIIITIGDGVAELASVHAPGAHAVGAYATMTGILVLLVWAVRTTAARCGSVAMTGTAPTAAPAPCREGGDSPPGTVDSGTGHQGTGGR